MMFIRFATFASLCFCTAVGSAQEAAKTTTIELAGGKLTLEAPDAWKSEEPKSRIVQYEFSAPKDAKEDSAARITIMGAGGGVEANLDRWYGQFDQPDGSATKKKAKVENFDVAGHKVYYVDVTGTFKDTMGAGPFSGRAPKMREDHRMLGAIIVTEELGQYFVKITGPAESLEKLSEGFKKMLKEMKSK